MKEVINVLWAIEKDLRVIASNTEASLNRKALFSATRETPSAFKLKTSLPLNLPKVSHEEFHNYILPMINGITMVLIFTIGYLMGFMS
ncbi:hypothetical protein GPK34_00050 [Secundilactobacillus kimchicus]|uniref:hypothetical protein n=1 Tax=Secundilactobacillus kimchicus TaxID=528209 RepID=UPI001C01E276|nr:hypothetical protein [Secundilactobacillus kimchicus]MBT9670427.1 hypothetical protein [Secundilactobacillus kimchicus]